MGIYIPSLDAPEKCNGCCMNLSGHCLANKGLYVGRDNLEYNSKPDWCPLIELPPHGRLGDLDALFDKAYTAYGVDMDEHEANQMMEMVSAAPTIIPPEGGEKV